MFTQRYLGACRTIRRKGNTLRDATVYSQLRIRSVQTAAATAKMDDEFDSGDDLFANVDADELAMSIKRPFSSDLGDDVISQKPRLTGPQATHADIAQQILRDKFGYSAFRHEQEQAIQAILGGQNAAAIFPTGAGKSLCYQIPAIAFEQLDAQSGERTPPSSGITIVVSPLIALMKDQVDALKGRGIMAECSDSTKTYDENQQIEAHMQSGRLRLLYVSPEKLNNERFVSTIKYVPGGIRLVAVDEAHCISEWGHSFRPDYLKVARFTEEIKAERVICLTATATPRVADDICQAFKIDKANVFKTSPYRPNLDLDAVPFSNVKDKVPHLVSFLNKHDGPSLVYVTTHKQTEQVVAELMDNGISATGYHAGMRSEDRQRIQEDFMASKIRIVVATIAFGMGIDKSNIRNVVHWDIPATIEEYSQQIGRAGRDGLQSHCVLYFCPHDFQIRESFARGDLPSLQSIEALLKDLFSRQVVEAKEGPVIKVNQKALSDEYDIRSSPLGVLIAALELKSGLLRAITPEYTKYQFEDMGKYFIAMKDTSPAAQAIVRGSVQAVKLYALDMINVCQQTSLSRVDLIRTLDKWHSQGMIKLKVSGVENRFRILKDLPKTDVEISKLAQDLFEDMSSREKEALKRLQQVIDLVTGEKCYALTLADHFGMSLSDGKVACGHCTFCRTSKPIEMPVVERPAVNLGGIQKILAQCFVRDDPRFLTRVAFGIGSPRATQLKMSRSPLFGSLAGQDFESLLSEFTVACRSEKFKNKSEYSAATTPGVGGTSNGRGKSSRSTSTLKR